MWSIGKQLSETSFFLFLCFSVDFFCFFSRASLRFLFAREEIRVCVFVYLLDRMLHLFSLHFVLSANNSQLTEFVQLELLRIHQFQNERLKFRPQNETEKRERKRQKILMKRYFTWTDNKAPNNWINKSMQDDNKQCTMNFSKKCFGQPKIAQAGEQTIVSRITTKHSTLIKSSSFHFAVFIVWYLFVCLFLLFERCSNHHLQWPKNGRRRTNVKKSGWWQLNGFSLYIRSVFFFPFVKWHWKCEKYCRRNGIDVWANKELAITKACRICRLWQLSTHRFILDFEKINSIACPSSRPVALITVAKRCKYSILF